MRPPTPGMTKRNSGGRWEKLSTRLGVGSCVRKVCTAAVAARKPTEAIAPANPTTPAQNNVTCRSVTWARSLNQTQNLSRLSGPRTACSRTETVVLRSATLRKSALAPKYQAAGSRNHELVRPLPAIQVSEIDDPRKAARPLHC